MSKLNRRRGAKWVTQQRTHRALQVMSIHGERIKKVQKRMQPDSLLLLPAAPAQLRNRDTHFPYRAHSDIIYLTGVNEEELALAITPEAVHFFAQTRDPERERWVGPVKGHEFLQQQLSAEGLDVVAHDNKEFTQSCGEMLKGRRVLYFDFGQYADFDRQLFKTLHELISYSRRGTLGPRTVIRASELLHECRLIKDEFDLVHMRRAAEISAAAHNRAREFILSATGEVSEARIKAIIEHEFMAAGADRLAYPSIVAAGANATVLHYEGSGAVAGQGDFILIDAGCEVHGYASDITRTTLLGGKGGELKSELYALVLEAQHSAIRNARSGASVDDVHMSAVKILAAGLLELKLFDKVPERPKKDGSTAEKYVKVTSLDEVLEKEYYNLFYMHRTSHYLGLDVHDVGDYFIDGKSRVLEPGMVITVEPGLYFPPEYDFLDPQFRGIGIRIEDDVLITSGENEVLTRSCLS